MEIKISVPTSLSDITLREYKQYEKIVNTNDQDENSERFINTKMVEIFCGINYEQASAMTLIDFERIVVQLYDILQQTPKLVTRFKMGDSEFGFIPDLEKMTFGEYVDLDTYIHDMRQIEKAMAVLYRPIKYKQKDLYEIHDYEGDLYHDAMLNMPLDAVVSSILFFYNLGIDLSNAMMNSSEVEDQALLAQLRALGKNGTGINPSTPSLKAILGDLTI
jgi:hypothetical protein